MSEVIGVVGAGTMGNGIAQVAARAGYDVVLHDVSEEFLSVGSGRSIKACNAMSTRKGSTRKRSRPSSNASVQRLISQRSAMRRS